MLVSVHRFQKTKSSVWMMNVLFSVLFCFRATFTTSHHPPQDVEDADAVNGDEGGEIGRDVDPLQGTSRRIEGLQGFSCLHIPPLREPKKNKINVRHISSKEATLLLSILEGNSHGRRAHLALSPANTHITHSFHRVDNGCCHIGLQTRDRQGCSNFPTWNSN